MLARCGNALVIAPFGTHARGPALDVSIFFSQTRILEHALENPAHHFVLAGKWRVVSYSERENLTHLRASCQAGFTVSGSRMGDSFLANPRAPFKSSLGQSLIKSKDNLNVIGTANGRALLPAIFHRTRHARHHFWETSTLKLVLVKL